VAYIESSDRRTGVRDVTADIMKAAAERLTRKYPAHVSAVGYRAGNYEVQGFMVWLERTVAGHQPAPPVLYVAVRRRRVRWRWRGAWEEVASVAEAAAEVGALVRSIPD
jgi:hypothetical protein